MEVEVELQVKVEVEVKDTAEVAVEDEDEDEVRVEVEDEVEDEVKDENEDEVGLEVDVGTEVGVVASILDHRRKKTEVRDLKVPPVFSDEIFRRLQYHLMRSSSVSSIITRTSMSPDETKGVIERRTRTRHIVSTYQSNRDIDCKHHRQ